MSGLENAVTQCRGVEAQGNGSEKYDLGEENRKLKGQLDAAANKLTEQSSGVLSYFKKGPSSGDTLKMAAESSVSRQIEGISEK